MGAKVDIDKGGLFSRCENDASAEEPDRCFPAPVVVFSVVSGAPSELRKGTNEIIMWYRVRGHD